jgi:hypothetical protein
VGQGNDNNNPGLSGTSVWRAALYHELFKEGVNVEPQTTSTGHIFISYAREDERYVRKLGHGLRRRGFGTWIDDKRIDPGVEWWEEIEQAIRDCAAFVVVMTPRSSESKWVPKEIHLALDEGKPIFPLLLHGEKFSVLGDIHYTDVSGILPRQPDDDFYERLEQKLRARSEEDGEVEEPESGEKEPPAPEKPTPGVWSRLAHLPPLAIVILLLLGALLVGVLGWLVASKLLAPTPIAAPNPTAVTAVETALPPTDIGIATATPQPPSPTPSAAPEAPLGPPTPTVSPTTMPTPDPLRPDIKLGPDPSNPFPHEDRQDYVFTFQWDGGCIVSEDFPANLTEMDIELRRGQGEGSDTWLGTTNIDAIKDGLGCDTAANRNTFKLQNLQDARAISGLYPDPDGNGDKSLGVYPPEQSLYWRLKICDEGGVCWHWAGEP